MFQKNIKKKVESINEKASKNRYVNLKAYICNIIMLIAIVTATVPLLVNNYIRKKLLIFFLNILKINLYKTIYKKIYSNTIVDSMDYTTNIVSCLNNYIKI